MAEVKCIKLLTGEEVIAEFNKIGDSIKLINPIRVSMVHSVSGSQPNFGFSPFPLVSNDKELTIHESHVIYVCNPAEEFLVQYNEIFSKIITPSKGLIV